METYEQKYNEIVERIKELHDAGNSLTKKQMEIILPELRDSEDERIRKDVLAFIRREGQHIDKYKWHKWIAWLEKQKPVEWSEDDEIGLEETMWCVNEAVQNAKTESDKQNAKTAENWLKSLRPQPHWKPNKEQMKALWEIYQGGKAQAPIASLYEDLKKL